jgi:hypothetical protein
MKFNALIHDNSYCLTLSVFPSRTVINGSYDLNNMLNPEVERTRKLQYEINPLIINRWSPRSMTGENLNDSELFEAARWSPSSFNGQPWRFIYARRSTEHWDRLFNLLVESNKVWTKNAAALVVIISRKNFEHNEKPSITHQFDTGAAWQNLALEASSRGIVAHGITWGSQIALM